MRMVENLAYWANYKIDTIEGQPPTCRKQIADDAAQIIAQNFKMSTDSAMGMILAAGRAIGEAGLIVDPYTNAFYQFCLMVSESQQGEVGP